MRCVTSCKPVGGDWASKRLAGRGERVEGATVDGLRVTGRVCSMEWTKRVLVTGGAGFIGSHFVGLLRRRHPEWLVVNLDLLTYAADLHNLEAVLGPEAANSEVPWGGRLVGQDAAHVLVRGDVAD